MIIFVHVIQWVLFQWAVLAILSTLNVKYVNFIEIDYDIMCF
jgi:hypothetical protein